MDEQVVDLPKKYGFQIVLRDLTQFDYLSPFVRYIIYFVIENDEMYLITTHKSVAFLGDETTFGLDPLSGYCVDFLEKDYQIAYHDERDKCVFTEELFIRWKKDGNFSEHSENKLNCFYRRRKIKSILDK
jgi:hypothetical protein